MNELIPTIEALIKMLPPTITLKEFGFIEMPSGESRRVPFNYTYRLYMQRNSRTWAAGYMFWNTYPPINKLHLEQAETLRDALNNLYRWYKNTTPVFAKPTGARLTPDESKNE